MYFWHHSAQALWSNTRVLVRTTYSSWAVSRNHIHTNGFGKRLHYNIDNDPFLGAFWQENGIIKTARQKLQLSLKKMTQSLPWIFVDLLEIDRLQVDYVQWKTVATGRWIWVYWASTITWQKAQCANHVHTFGWTCCPNTNGWSIYVCAKTETSGKGLVSHPHLCMLVIWKRVKRYLVRWYQWIFIVTIQCGAVITRSILSKAFTKYTP